MIIICRSMAGGGPLLWLQGKLTSSADAQSAVFASLLWFGALVTVLLLAFLVVLWTRRHCRWVEIGPVAGFDLADLRRQRDQGILTDAEYEALRCSVLQSLEKGRCQASG